MAVGAYLTIYDRGIGHAIEIIALDADGNALVHYDSDEYDEPPADAWIEERKIKQAKRVTSKAKNAGVRWNRSYAQATPRTQRAVTVHPPEDDNVPEWTTGERPEPSSAGYWTYGDDDKPVRVEKYEDAAARSYSRSYRIEDDERTRIAMLACKMGILQQTGAEWDARSLWQRWQRSSALRGEAVEDPDDEG